MRTEVIALLTNGCNIVIQFVVFGLILILEKVQVNQDAYVEISITMLFGHILFIDGVLSKNVYQIWSYSIFLVYLCVMIILRGFCGVGTFIFIFLILVWYVLLVINIIVNLVFFRLLFYEFAWSSYALLGANTQINGKCSFLIELHTN
ncbi:putative transporter [Trachipleistophora hominis]|uniref:Putative transporter n=1 Tax=Trachipleistophora hominis TaxID=72359 RepID=L7JZ75_TRAHO|nr:putative transporter [Trachipleistophora hominis]